METTNDKSAGSTRSWMLRWLGILWAVGTVISLAKRGLVIELAGLPQIIYQQYAWLRDMLFEPLVWVVPKLSPEVKDWMMLYALISATAWRGCVRYYRVYHDRSATLYERTFFALFWPLMLVSNTVTGALAVEAIIVGSVTVAFFFWNYLGNVYGPS